MPRDEREEEEEERERGRKWRKKKKRREKKYEALRRGNKGDNLITTLDERTRVREGKERDVKVETQKIRMTLHSDSGHLENWTKIFHCQASSGASE